MKIHTALGPLRACRQPVAMAAGFFDGIHRGHLRVIRRTLAAARRLGGEAWILTFDTHPRHVTRPDKAPALLTSARHRLSSFERLGVDGCLLLPFRPALARLRPQTFIRRLATHCPGLRRMLVGADWRFGRDGAGDTRLLAALGRECGFAVSIVQPVRQGAHAVSSTRVRRAVLAGRLREAAAMLGRPFSVLGTVIRGRGVGRRIGFPTANLATCNEILPPRGVYAVRVRTGDQWLDGIVNIGVRPTFRVPGTPSAVHLEIHLLRHRQNLYRREMEVFFIARIRPERAFPGSEELARQIARDIRRATGILARPRRSKKAKESLYTA